MNNSINTNLNTLINDTYVKGKSPSTQDKVSLKDLTANNKELSQSAISAEQGLNNIIDKLLTSIKGNKDFSLLNTSMKDLKLVSNLTSEIKNLSKLLKQDPELKVFANKLEDIINTKLKDPNALLKSINNSGLFLESKLRINLNNQVLPNSFFDLISKMKNLKNEKLKNEIFSLDSDELDTKTSLDKLDAFILNKLGNLKNSSSKTISLINFLNNSRRYLQKNKDLMKLIKTADKIDKKLDIMMSDLLKEESSIKEHKSSVIRFASLKNEVSEVKRFIYDVIKNPSILKRPNLTLDENNENKIIKLVASLKSNINNQDISKEILKDYANDFIKDMQEEIKLLDNKQIQQALLGNDNFKNILNQENLSLQNKIANLVKLLSANLKNEESYKNFLDKSELKDLKTSLNKSKKDIKNIQTRTQEHINNAINNDIKANLLKISNIALEKQNQVVYDSAQKMLNQIELNQLLSIASKEINTFLPYMINDLEESSVKFKMDGNDKCYAQVKLNFKQLGKINVLLSLQSSKYLDINIMVENQEFQHLLIQNAKEFKANLTKIGLISSKFFISKLVEQNYDEVYQMDLGFSRKI